MPLFSSKTLKILLIAVIVQPVRLCSLHAQHASATQQLTMEVKPITSLTVSENPHALVIIRSAAEAGILSTSDHSTHYSLVTNVENMKISVSIDRPMPQGTSLTVSLGGSKGYSKGEVDISHTTSPTEVVTNIRAGSALAEDITYTFRAAPEIARLRPESRTVTLTLTN